MPELPEVETVKRTLAPVVGLEVMGASTSQFSLRHDISTRKLKSLFLSKTIVDIKRLGKYLLILFSDSDKGLLVHLGMSGRLRFFDKDQPKAKHTHLILKLSTSKELRYSDPRRFGIVDVFPTNNPKNNRFLAKLGSDALEDTVSAKNFYDIIKNRKTHIKTILLDQRVLCGIGNIYASEALWISKIHPLTRPSSLDLSQTGALLKAIKKTLNDALDKGGTSLRDFVNADGHKGENIHYLKVYGRESLPCPRCTTPITSFKISNRSTFVCVSCQKEH